MPTAARGDCADRSAGRGAHGDRVRPRRWLPRRGQPQWREDVSAYADRAVRYLDLALSGVDGGQRPVWLDPARRDEAFVPLHRNPGFVRLVRGTAPK